MGSFETPAPLSCEAEQEHALRAALADDRLDPTLGALKESAIGARLATSLRSLALGRSFEMS